MHHRSVGFIIVVIVAFFTCTTLYAEFDVIEDSLLDLKLDINKFSYIPELKIGVEVTDTATYDKGDYFETMYYLDIDENNLGLLCVKLETDTENIKIRMYYSHYEEVLKKSIKVFKTSANKGYIGERLLQQVSLGRYYLRVTEKKKTNNQKYPTMFTIALDLDKYEPNGYKEKVLEPWWLEDWECTKKSSIINSPGDVDWYKIKLWNQRYSNTLKIYIPSPDGRDEDNLEFRVFTETGKSLAVWNDYSGWLELSVPEGVYYVRVARIDRSFSRAIFRKYDIYFSLGYCVVTNNSESSMPVKEHLVNSEKIPAFSPQEPLVNIPNPFNPETDIVYEVTEIGKVVLNVFSTKGKKVIELVNGNKDAGLHRVHWNGKDSRGKDMPSGVYYAVLEVNGKRFTKKMIMLK